ncbi:hypothetical protein HH219_00050 [Pseudoalteromonas sp. NEC-BIFX-2020_015]|uniref:hypothetical protein n=1 Tax=Pseudoalteromonas sp. NEC-BIFX-2020_015 TaxID=2729544 RepID=UPI00146134D2|nr:hypothetical protein [Pseudoalteromonas sp. NEC-BIFX-2020_015]NMR23948.1 hypothetical protein [Pseudoalteromonas sp. NEC-BIFX-2020_015]
MNNTDQGRFLIINSDCFSYDFLLDYESVEKLSELSNLCLFYSAGSNVNVKEDDLSGYRLIDPLVVHINKTPTELKINSSQLAMGNIYYLDRGNGIEAVSSDPAILAALFDCELSKNAIFQDVSIGFRLGSLSIFENVYKLNARKYIKICNNKITIHEMIIEPLSFDIAEERLLDTLPKMVAECFSNDYAVELTGGIDSRLVYALGLAGGVSPKVNFTIGKELDSDVQIAKLISKLSGSDHFLISDAFDAQKLVEDGSKFVSLSGFCANAASYSWLPTVYRKLESKRTGQLSGAGGECAGDFYFTPFDSFISSRYIFETWVKKRLYLTGNKMMSDVGHHQSLHENLTSSIYDILNTKNSQTWRSSLVSLYSEHRVKNWVGPVLNASSGFYDVAAPLLTDYYLCWANAVPNELRKNRQAQLALINKINPNLAKIPYGSQLGNSSLLNSKLIVKSRKVYNRVIGLRGKSDLGSTSTIRSLINNETIKNSLPDIMNEFLGIENKNLTNILKNPDVYTSQLGFLVTACWAKERLQSLKLKYKKT